MMEDELEGCDLDLSAGMIPASCHSEIKWIISWFRLIRCWARTDWSVWCLAEPWQLHRKKSVRIKHLSWMHHSFLGWCQFLSKSRDSMTFFWLCRAIRSLMNDSVMNHSESVSTTASVLEMNGQATKSSRRIPWHTEAMKDVVTCDKSRGAGNTLWSGNFRMGQPLERPAESIGWHEPTQRTETS